jgi:hypothetical protein
MNSTGFPVSNSSWGETGFPISPVFWGTTVSPRARLIPGEGTLINATPTEIIVWPGAQSGEDYNPMNNSIYTAHKTVTEVLTKEGLKKETETTHTWEDASTTEAEFVQWCESIQCKAIFQVPGEIEDAATAAWVVNYTEEVGQIYDPAIGRNITKLGFHPAYWEIGNEPQLWKLANYSWRTWPVGNGTLPTLKVTPTQYASLVYSFTIAMRNVDSNIKIIGLPAAGRPDPYPVQDWVTPVVAIDGGLDISGVAYHSYPASRIGDPTLQNYYAAINGSAGLNGRVADVRAGILAGTEQANTTCSAACGRNIGVYVTEFGTALSHQVYGHFSTGFPGALDFAAQIPEAIDLNVSNVDVFGAVFNTNNSWLNLTGVVRPSYTLFSEILNHLGNVAFQASLRTPPQFDGGNTSLGGNLYSLATVDTKSANRADLLVVNLNTSTSVSFSPQLPLLGGGTISSGTPAELWEWQGNVNSSAGWVNATVTPTTSAPVAVYLMHGLPKNWTLPPQTVALFEAYPGGGVQFNFTAKGFQGGDSTPRWYVDVAGSLETANNTDVLTDYLQQREYSVSAPSIPLKDGSPVAINNTERYARERLEPFLPPSIQVSPLSFSQNIYFAHQWWTNVSTNSSNGLSGVGGYVAPSPQWWNASSPLVLTARPAFHYVFTHWVGFGAGSSNSTNTTVIINPAAPISEKAFFAWGYPVTFSEVGLPPGTSWGVTLRSNWSMNGTVFPEADPGSSVSNALGFEEPNGTFGFTIDTVPGYRSSVNDSSYLTNSSVAVSGRAASISITFTRVAPRYAVTFEEIGLPTGTRWWMTTLNVTTNQNGPVSNPIVRHLTQSSQNSTMTFEEANGSYGYNTSSIRGFEAHPPAFGYNVSGPGRVVLIQFSNVSYYVIWKETGLGPNLSWSVVVSNGSVTTTYKSAGAWTTVRLVNGTYSFVIPKMADYVPVTNESGTFTVNGANVSFNVLFPQVSFPVTFVVSGLPSGDTWQVRFSDNLTLNLSQVAATFRAPNGSYTFDVMAPAGYLACPSHGTITVDAAAIVINVSLGVGGPPPCPPIWKLACPAIVACAVIAMVGVGVLLVGRTQKRRRSGGTP